LSEPPASPRTPRDPPGQKFKRRTKINYLCFCTFSEKNGRKTAKPEKVTKHQDNVSLPPCPKGSIGHVVTVRSTRSSIPADHAKPYPKRVMYLFLCLSLALHTSLPPSLSPPLPLSLSLSLSLALPLSPKQDFLKFMHAPLPEPETFSNSCMPCCQSLRLSQFHACPAARA